MAAKTHLQPETHTRLAGEVNGLVRSMRNVQEELIRLTDIFGQIGLDGDTELSLKMGFASADDANAAKSLLASAKGEVLADAFYQQVISRMG